MTILSWQKNILMAILFLVGIIIISYEMWFWSIAVIVLLIFLSIKNSNLRFICSMFIFFLVSLIIYQIMNVVIGQYDFSIETRILLNRSLLLIIVAGLYISHRVSKKEFFFYHQMPRWSRVIELPFHSIKLSNLMIIVILSSGAVFLPFVLQQEIITKSFIVFCLLFSLINATLEEWIWRGILLSSLVKYATVSYALVVTSIGFGLLHLIIGIPLFLCLFFSVGGLFYGVMVLKTNSIFPSIIFHIVINIGMVLSGFIL